MSLEMIFKLHLNEFEYIEISEDGDELGLVQLELKFNYPDKSSDPNKINVIRFDTKHASDLMTAINQIQIYIKNKHKFVE